MFVVEPVPQMPRSVQPAGGSPADDAAYLEWREVFLERSSERHWLRLWHEAPDAPDPCPPWTLDRELYRRLGGEMPLFGGSAPVTYNHRLRWLAIAYRDRRRALTREAERIVSEHADDACQG
jgi:hypothetical protein